MALIKCEECGHMISDKAGSCPNCGCPREDEEAVQVEETKRIIYVGTNLCDVGIYGKSRMTFALLAFFLGYLGAHLFYIGRGIGGALNLIVTIIVLFLMIDYPICGAILGIIGIISTIHIIKSLTMTLEDFDETYVDSENFYPL